MKKYIFCCLVLFSFFSLKKIVYPTKGYTEFEYENNTYDPNKSFINDKNASKNSFFRNNNQKKALGCKYFSEFKFFIYSFGYR